MEKYGVCKSEKVAGMGPSIGYCETCHAPIVAKNGSYEKTCDCEKGGKVITFGNK